MSVFLQKHWFKVLIVVLIAAAVAGWIYKTRGGTENYPVLGQAADFKLEQLDGKTGGLTDDAGKVRLVYFFWSSCPDVCQPTTYELSKVQEELQKAGLLGTDAVMYSISFDPTRDTVEQLKKYSARFNADPNGWKFMRGEQKAVIDLARKYAVSVLQDNNGNFGHTNSVALVDRSGNIRKYFIASDGNLSYRTVADAVKTLAKTQ
ncbi:SCO family protein [Paenibacillus ginsengarvi]|uniref:SCO family protein n=1 Tax=Paenibacillus ginsengarvi TaxID=400777 RepID=A0A3B0CB04_9BACL|nr:SCO family protein [Paenibacillus ginsengarvi]RKN80737.1 SCO family protein [Paenibacillus ginsengarvi]